jgi:hypothetical protein
VTDINSTLKKIGMIVAGQARAPDRQRISSARSEATDPAPRRIQAFRFLS